MAIQKLNNETKWDLVKAVAAALQMEIFGINKKALVPMLNQKIEELGDQAETILTPVFAQFDESAPTQTTTTADKVKSEDKGKKQAASSENQPKQNGNTSTPTSTSTPAAPKVKWYEVVDANPYAVGATVEIYAGKDLIGRNAVIIKPSNKVKALKARLVNPKDGSLQGCEICLDFDRIRPVQTAPVQTEELKDQNPASENADESKSEGSEQASA